MRVCVALLTLLLSYSVSAETLDTETECLALNIYHEARNQDIQGQIAVGLVTLNRVKQNGWPSTICGVVWQPYQFSWTHDGKPDRPYNKEAWKKIVTLAKLLVTHTYPDFTHGSNHYHARYIKPPKWTSRFTQVAVIGDHIFYR